MSRTTNCRYCGHNIDVAIALHNTGTPYVCAIDPEVICEAPKRTIKAIETRA
ncbi:hypothetical protein ACFVS2_11425 [Brevibacillus sp. NPDC058079]|uniref:hypothetical protein n=1 Tax=Brevibacillus sp. NPDC058079 TaxID=3346330 RepID=UPI0036E605FA